jgi:hypothetical protein
MALHLRLMVKTRKNELQHENDNVFSERDPHWHLDLIITALAQSQSFTLSRRNHPSGLGLLSPFTRRVK